MEDFDILFLGGVYPESQYEKIRKNCKGNMQNAANNHQWMLIEGLEKNLGRPINILNFMFVGSFPLRYKKPFIKTFSFSHKDKANDINVGFFNFTGLKQLILKRKVKIYLKKWDKKSFSKRKILIVYSPQTYFLKGVNYIKRLNPKIETCIVIPDLPQFTSLEKHSMIFNLYKKYNLRIFNNEIHNFDYYVLITETMKEFLKIDNKPSVVIETLVNCHNTELMNQGLIIKKQEIKTILYSGTLTEKYGILELIEAFKKIEKENYRLIICGEGETRDKVIEETKKDQRIIYKGLISRDEVIKLQQKATVLVNPRKSEGFTRFSFPSKISEYLCAGKPVICYKLEGIPVEYDDYLIYVEDNSIDSLKEKLVEICEKDEKVLKEIGERNKRFVSENKNNVVQTRKIINMLNIFGDENEEI